MKNNFYQILNVSETATLEEIKKSYRILALKYHPDRNRKENAHNKFIEINIAYETLKNIDLREKYDKELKNTEEESKNEFEQYSKDKHKEKAERYANMSFEQFKSVLDNLIVVGKKIKKTANIGCGWILAIIFFPLSIISFISAIVGGNFSIIILSLVLALFGYGGYAMAKGE